MTDASRHQEALHEYLHTNASAGSGFQRCPPGQLAAVNASMAQRVAEYPRLGPNALAAHVKELDSTSHTPLLEKLQKRCPLLAPVFSAFAKGSLLDVRGRPFSSVGAFETAAARACSLGRPDCLVAAHTLAWQALQQLTAGNGVRQDETTPAQFAEAKAALADGLTKVFPRALAIVERRIAEGSLLEPRALEEEWRQSALPLLLAHRRPLDVANISPHLDVLPAGGPAPLAYAVLPICAHLALVNVMHEHSIPRQHRLDYDRLFAFIERAWDLLASPPRPFDGTRDREAVLEQTFNTFRDVSLGRVASFRQTAARFRPDLERNEAVKRACAAHDRFAAAGVAEGLVDSGVRQRATQIFSDTQSRLKQSRDRYGLLPCSNEACVACEMQPKQFKVCSRCRTVRYCGRDCQVADYKQHKKACKAAAEDA